MAEIDVRGAMTLINSELQSLESMLTGYPTLVEEVGWAQRNTPSEMKEFTVERKTKLVNCLTEAEAGFRAEIVTPADVKIKLTRVLSILQKVSVVVSTENFVGRFGDPHEIVICKYAADHPRGMYQEWKDGKFSRTIPREEFEETHPEVGSLGSEARMPVMVEMRSLLGLICAP